MKKRVVIEKEVGETPRMAIERWKRAHPECASLPASYAGRLDPMASGKLLVLFGDECRRQERYRGFDKEYVIEVLLDAGSDTGDALGVAAYAGRETRVDGAALARILKKEVGRHVRPYPAFSSKPVAGKPLFLHALEGTLDGIEIPTHEERVYSVSLLEAKRVTSTELLARVGAFLDKAPKTDEPSKAPGADFRIREVRRSWDALFAEAGERRFALLTLRVSCGSGTYMRALAGRIGESLSTKALALSIRRTRIGKRRGPLWLPY